MASRSNPIVFIGSSNQRLNVVGAVCSELETIAPATISATVKKGLQGASKAIEAQKPHVRRYFPQIDECRSGTINLALNAPLEIRFPDIVTPPITWCAGGDERFGITAIELELSEVRHEAWIYTAERSLHRFNPFMVEVVAKEIPGIEEDCQCLIHIQRCLLRLMFVV